MVPRSDSLFVSILSVYMCVVSMSLPMYHSSVVVKLFLVRPLLLVCILLYLISLIYLPLLLLMSFASNFVLILAC